MIEMTSSGIKMIGNGLIRTVLIFSFLASVSIACKNTSEAQVDKNWGISVLPPSIRLNPVTNEIIESKSTLTRQLSSLSNMLQSNWVYDGKSVNLQSARGEYISYQLVLTNYSQEVLNNIQITSTRFKNGSSTIAIDPELFLEWSVEVLTPSTGYPNATLGKGWYPDALIPFEMLQLDSSKVQRWTYPIRLPDFNNRIEGQKSLIVWVDQYVPFDRAEALPGNYTSSIEVTIGDRTESIPVELEVWDFAIPNRNIFGASLQHEGFVSRMSEDDALEIYQLMKRNRISVMDPTYQPGLTVKSNGSISLDWSSFDKELKKYFDGSAFTKEYGYAYGPGYGEPIENFVLPFDVYGKHHTRGWPDTGTPDVEQDPKNVAIYIEAIKKVRSHLQKLLDPTKTDLTVYLNGLDESYFKEAWERMVFYGDLFDQYYPEAHFRIDGGYSEEAMEFVSQSIDYWGSHTINYNADKVKKYQEMGIKDWLYGPMVYESESNGWVGSSTFLDLPLVNDRAISWSSWKYGIHSWLSWGIGAGWEHAWYDPETWKDVYKSGSGSDRQFPYKKINGSAMLVYSGGIVPNVNRPCPSIRLKTLRNGVQEYEYMRLLTQLNGSSKATDRIVNEIINKPFGEDSFGVLEVWDYDPKKWDMARIEMGNMMHKIATEERK